MPRLKPLVGICGDAGAGKDTLATGIAKTDVYFVYPFAMPIKAALNSMFGWSIDQWFDREWKETPIPWLGKSPRYLAQTLGTEWGREIIDPEIWLKIAQQKFEKVNTTAQVVEGRIMGLGMIVPDVRFENEARWIKDAGGILFKVERPGHEEISESSHASEAGIDPALIDAVIMNDGPPSKMIAEGRTKLWALSGLSRKG